MGIPVIALLDAAAVIARTFHSGSDDAIRLDRPDRSRTMRAFRGRIRTEKQAQAEKQDQQAEAPSAKPTPFDFAGLRDARQARGGTAPAESAPVQTTEPVEEAKEQ